MEQAHQLFSLARGVAGHHKPGLPRLRRLQGGEPDFGAGNPHLIRGQAQICKFFDLQRLLFGLHDAGQRGIARIPHRVGAAEGDQCRKLGLHLQFRPFNGPVDHHPAVRHLHGHRQSQMGNTQEFGHHDAHLVLVVIHRPMAAENKIKGGLLEDRGQDPGLAQGIATLRGRIVHQDAVIGAHSQGRAHRLHRALGPQAENGDFCPLAVLEAQSRLHRILIVRIDDPFEVARVDGLAVRVDPDHRFRIRHLLQQDCNIHRFSLRGD